MQSDSGIGQSVGAGLRRQQPETLVVFDNDVKAWEHYSREYDAVKETASDKLDVPLDLREAEIAFTDTPVMRDPGPTVFQAPPVEELSIPQVVQKVEELAVPIDRVVTPQVSRGKRQIHHKALRKGGNQETALAKEVSCKATSTNPPVLQSTRSPDTYHCPAFISRWRQKGRV